MIDKAIQKYGAHNFWYEILESQIEDYNEKEVYWIKKYNSVKPNGYNIQTGGEEPVIEPTVRPEPSDDVPHKVSLDELLEDIRNM